MAPPTLIPDASVAVKWVVEEPDSDRARYLRDLFVDEAVRFVVPSLLFYEVANAVRFTADLSDAERRDAVAKVHALEMEAADPDPDRMARAVQAATELDASVYDATYLVLAQEHDGVMVTADRKFARRAGPPHVATLEAAHAEMEAAFG